MEWFEDWFNTPYYHLLYRDRDHLEAESFIENIAQYSALKKGQRVLDLPCGKGRHAIFLHARGLDVTGVDLAMSNIEAAQKFEKPNLRFFVHDMRNPLTERYDVVFNFFTSFGYFKSESENQKAFGNLADAMATGGTLLIDFINVEKLRRNLVADEVVQRGDLAFHLTRRIRDGFISKTIKFTDRGRRYAYEERVKYLTVTDFKRYLKPTGLSLKKLFGSYDLKAFDEKNSDRLIILAH